MPVSALRFVSVALIVALALTGCASHKKKDILPGRRISVLELDKQLEPDAAIIDVPVALPKPAPNDGWTVAGGDPAHDLGHPALGDTLKQAWSVSIGEGASRRGVLIASPLYDNGTLYTMDAHKLVSAFSADDGHTLWQTDISPKDDNSRAWGGGIGIADGVIYAATGFSELLALDAKDGHVIWRVAMPAPVHSSPTIADGRVYVVTTDAQMIALSAKDGHEFWRYSDIAEPAVLAGNASPAVSGDVVVAPFPSGDIVALRVDNGLPLWSDNLTVSRHFDAMSTLADIHAAPVIDRGLAFVVGHSGEMVAIDLRTGERAWEQDIGGASQPWAAGDYIYVLSSNGALMCLTQSEGRVRWITQLDQREDPTDEKSKPIVWSGPLLAGDRLIVVSSNAQAWSVSPYTGAPLGKLDLSGPSFLTPVVAGGSLYILADDGTLTALR
jgi:outer membrane protein assembly factor BamB